MPNKTIFYIILFFIVNAFSNNLLSADISLPATAITDTKSEKINITIRLMPPQSDIVVPMLKTNLTLQALREEAKKIIEDFDDYNIICAGRLISNNTIFNTFKNSLLMGDELHAVFCHVFTVEDQNGALFDLKISILSLSGAIAYLSKNYDLIFDSDSLSFDQAILESDQDLLRACEVSKESGARIYVKTKSKAEKLNEWGNILGNTTWEPNVNVEAPVEPNYYPSLPGHILTMANSGDFRDISAALDYGDERAEIFENFFIGNIVSTFMAIANMYGPDISIINLDPRDLHNIIGYKKVDYAQIKINDCHDKFEELARIFDENHLQEKIDSTLMAGKKVLIACQMGQSRSVTIGIVYLMKKFHLSAIQAFHVIKNRRKAAEPNAGFLSGLLKLEDSLDQVNDLDPALAQCWLEQQAIAPATFWDNFQITGDDSHNMRKFKASANSSLNLWDLVSILKLAQVEFEKVSPKSNSILEITFVNDFSSIKAQIEKYLSSHHAESSL